MNENQVRDVGADFRASMRHVAASAYIVATRDAALNCHGMVVTSAVSLSMDPFSMMVAVNRDASMYGPLVETGRFSLNLLRQTQIPLITAFSRSDMRDRRFTDADWTFTDDGIPVLRGALATHICTVVAAHDHGTHTVFFGNVTDMLLGLSDHTDDSLVWYGGRQRHLLAPTA